MSEQEYILGTCGLWGLPYFLEYILPLLLALLARVRHLLDGHNLLVEIAAGVVDGTERAMANFA